VVLWSSGLVVEHLDLVQVENCYLVEEWNGLVTETWSRARLASRLLGWEVRRAGHKGNWLSWSTVSLSFLIICGFHSILTRFQDLKDFGRNASNSIMYADVDRNDPSIG
jgi:hypothetical protein